MKKVLALLLSLMLLCSGLSALAEEEATTFYGKLYFDEGILESIFNPLGEEMRPEEKQLMATIQSILDNVGFYGVFTPDQTLMTLTLKDTPVTGVLSQVKDGESRTIIDLVPNYVLVAPAEEAAAAPATLEEMNAWLEKFEAAMGEKIAPLLSEMEEGEFTVLSSLIFNRRQKVNMDLKTYIDLFKSGLSQLESFPGAVADPAMMAETFAKFDQILANLEANPENEVLFDITLYRNMDENGVLSDDMYCIVEMSNEENMTVLDLALIDGLVYASALVGDNIFASSDAMLNAALTGSDFATFMEFIASPGEAENSWAFSLDIYTGTYVGLYAEAAMEENALSVYTEMYIDDPEIPAILGEFAFIPGGEIGEVDMSGLTPITMDDLAGENAYALLNGLMADVQLYGLNNLIANAAQAMPNEIISLITMMNTPAAPAEETTTVEGVNDGGSRFFPGN